MPKNKVIQSNSEFKRILGLTEEEFFSEKEETLQKVIEKNESILNQRRYQLLKHVLKQKLPAFSRVEYLNFKNQLDEDFKITQENLRCLKDKEVKLSPEEKTRILQLEDDPFKEEKEEYFKQEHFFYDKPVSCLDLAEDKKTRLMVRNWQLSCSRAEFIELKENIINNKGIEYVKEKVSNYNDKMDFSLFEAEDYKEFSENEFQEEILPKFFTSELSKRKVSDVTDNLMNALCCISKRKFCKLFNSGKYAIRDYIQECSDRYNHHNFLELMKKVRESRTDVFLEQDEKKSLADIHNNTFSDLFSNSSLEVDISDGKSGHRVAVDNDKRMFQRLFLVAKLIYILNKDQSEEHNTEIKNQLLENVFEIFSSEEYQKNLNGIIPKDYVNELSHSKNELKEMFVESFEKNFDYESPYSSEHIVKVSIDNNAVEVMECNHRLIIPYFNADEFSSHNTALYESKLQMFNSKCVMGSNHSRCQLNILDMLEVGIDYKGGVNLRDLLAQSRKINVDPDLEIVLDNVIDDYLSVKTRDLPSDFLFLENNPDLYSGKYNPSDKYCFGDDDSKNIFDMTFKAISKEKGHFAELVSSSVKAPQELSGPS